MVRDIPESLRSERTHLGGSFVGKGMDVEGEGIGIGMGEGGEGEGRMGAEMDDKVCMMNGSSSRDAKGS